MKVINVLEYAVFQRRANCNVVEDRKMLNVLA